MSAGIPSIAIDTYQDGRRALLYTEGDGAVTVVGKDGPVDLHYRAGSLILADTTDGHVIAGPIDPEGAMALAKDVLDGKPGAITDPLATLVLACVVLGWVPVFDPFDEPASSAAVIPEMSNG